MASTLVDFGAVHWRKSSYSNGSGGLCLEVADDVPGLVPVRDSKLTSGPTLVFPATAWAPFIEALAEHQPAR
ncbi:DUF397 domain-containing protein [Streptomyces sp. NPDC020607]|uniref:DUF397 domain-containing protein n=1 Tax=Streptomyces sp. NPDC020607 TaxID=3365082 RepID=UPI0037B70736